MACAGLALFRGNCFVWSLAATPGEIFQPFDREKIAFQDVRMMMTCLQIFTDVTRLTKPLRADAHAEFGWKTARFVTAMNRSHTFRLAGGQPSHCTYDRFLHRRQRLGHPHHVYKSDKAIFCSDQADCSSNVLYPVFIIAIATALSCDLVIGTMTDPRQAYPFEGWEWRKKPNTHG